MTAWSCVIAWFYFYSDLLLTTEVNSNNILSRELTSRGVRMHLNKFSIHYGKSENIIYYGL